MRRAMVASVRKSAKVAGRARKRCAMVAAWPVMARWGRRAERERQSVAETKMREREAVRARVNWPENQMKAQRQRSAATKKGRSEWACGAIGARTDGPASTRKVRSGRIVAAKVRTVWWAIGSPA